MAGDFGQRLGLGVGVPDGGRCQPVHHGLHGGEVRGGLLVHDEFGVVGEAQQRGLLGAEPDHVLDEVQDIEGAAVAAAADGGLVQAAADVPVLQGGEGGLVAGLDEGEQELALVPGGAGGFRGAGDIVGGQPGEVGGVVEQQGGGLHRLLDPLAELRAEPGELGIDGLEPFLAGVVELDAGLAELLEVLVHEAGGFGVELVRVDGGEPLEQPAG